ncbi:hypothetical protein BT96DRAFT_781166, partial [Gymnopus androsaceus JB14]
VIILFKAVGNAPILRQSLRKIPSSKKFQVVIQFLCKELGYSNSEPLHAFINMAFSPSPDDTVGNLFKVC